MPEIELLQPHTHAGQALAPGQRLTVSDRQAAWLLERGAARITERAKPSRKGAARAELEAAPETDEEVVSG